jgi:hypothetical protein
LTPAAIGSTSIAMRAWKIATGASVLALAILGACAFDSDEPAPAAPISSRGQCASTEALFPKLFEFLADDRFRSLREVIERRLLPTAAEPNPDPSLRTVLAAIVRLVRQLGLDEAATAVHLGTQTEVETELAPLLAKMLSFIDGRIDGRDHYDVSEAAAHFVDVCDPDDLLSAIEAILRFQSPSRGMPWIVAVLDEVKLILAEPGLRPFLGEFMQNSERGRPAVVGLIRQIMAFIADEDFEISRVETLLESVVDPLVDASLEARIDSIVALLGEATARDVGILSNLQGALRCGLRSPIERDVIIGFIYDLAFSPELGLDALLAGIDVIRVEAVQSELDLLADVVHVGRTDLTLRDDLRHLISLFLTKPDVEDATPVLIDLIESGVIAELLHGVLTILEGCT